VGSHRGAGVIAARVKIAARVEDYATHDEFGDASYAELLEHAERLSPGRAPARFEVEYRDTDPDSPTYGEYPDWEISGDAVEVTWDANGEATVTTLPPYSEQAP
jgi:hypothetical protein